MWPSGLLREYQSLRSELTQIIVEFLARSYSDAHLKRTGAMKSATTLIRQAKDSPPGLPADPSPAGDVNNRSCLQEGWVIANHILVSFHVAFISSVLAIPATTASREAVLHFIFF